MGRILRLMGGRTASPSDFPNLALWLDASFYAGFTFNSGNVSQWNDLSGKANHVANGTAAQQPLYVASGINGRPAVQFDDNGNFKFLSVADNATLDYTSFSIFVVIRRVNDLNTTETVCGKYSINAPSGQREFRVIVSAGDTGQVIAAQAGGADSVAADGGAATAGNNYIFDGNYTAGALNFAVNNGTVGSAVLASVNNGTSPFFVGCRDSGAEKFSGHVGEVVFYTTALSAQARLAILKYLSKKWGIAIN